MESSTLTAFSVHVVFSMLHTSLVTLFTLNIHTYVKYLTVPVIWVFMSLVMLSFCRHCFASDALLKQEYIFSRNRTIFHIDLKTCVFYYENHFQLGPYSYCSFNNKYWTTTWLTAACLKKVYMFKGGLGLIKKSSCPLYS